MHVFIQNNVEKCTLIFEPAVVGRVFADDETFSGKSETINLLKQQNITINNYSNNLLVISSTRNIKLVNRFNVNQASKYAIQHIWLSLIHI